MLLAVGRTQQKHEGNSKFFLEFGKHINEGDDVIIKEHFGNIDRCSQFCKNMGGNTKEVVITFN